MMMKSAAAINWDFPGDSIPAFLIIAGIPFMFNIAYGLIAGIISWILLHNIPLLLGKISPRLLPPGWDTIKEPYSITGTMKRGAGSSTKASMKTLLPPWVVKLLSGNMTFWRATPAEIETALEGRRLTQERNQIRADQIEREREQMRDYQSKDETGPGFRAGMLKPEKEAEMSASPSYSKDDEVDEEAAHNRRRGEELV